MDLDYAAFLGLLVYVLVRLFGVSLIVQLALSPLYAWSGFIALEEAAKARLWGTGLRWPVAFVFATWVCYSLKPGEGLIGFDALAELFGRAASHSGVIITAMAVTGGTAPFLAIMAKIEAMREKARAVTVQATAARAEVDRKEVVKVANADAATEHRDAVNGKV